MKSIAEQITGRERTLEENLYRFYAVLLEDYEPEIQRLRASFKGRFTSENLLSDSARDNYAISYFLFFPAYCKLDAAFGDDFRGSVDQLFEALRSANDEIIAEAYARDGPMKKSETKKLSAKVLSTEGADDHSVYIGEEHGDIDSLREKGLQSSDTMILFIKQQLNDTFCLVHGGTTVHGGRNQLFAYYITPKSELEKEIRLFPGYEQRVYKAVGTTGQLDVLERALVLLQIFGEEGHSSGITISYDGDGNARMQFERADGQAPSFPTDHLKFYRETGQKKEEITAKEFLSLAQEHNYLSWGEGGERVTIGYTYRDLDEGDGLNAFLLD